eukprot:TRINITY_DN28648_c0_g1_i1.p1 TRINITY_DN28648_c0_g1~~TRINITY_DN28648_c0_g1_i1.p1  ORF type:complete len:550 (-),score=48.77 TRINITY_DN28648_c0_g1_i1:129-1721(-)
MSVIFVLLSYFVGRVASECLDSDSALQPHGIACADNDTTIFLQRVPSKRELTKIDMLEESKKALENLKTQFNGANLKLDPAGRLLFNSGVSGKADIVKAIGTSVEAIDSCIKSGPGGCNGVKLASTILATSAAIMMAFSLAVPAGPLLAVFGSVILALFAGSESTPAPIDRNMIKSAVMDALGDFKMDEVNKVHYFVTSEEIQNQLDSLADVKSARQYESFRSGLENLKDWFERQASGIHQQFLIALGPESYRTRLKARLPFLSTCKSTCPPAKEWNDGDKCTNDLEMTQEEYGRVFRALPQIMLESTLLSYAHVALEKIYTDYAGEFSEKDWFQVNSIRKTMRSPNARRLVLERKSEQVKANCSQPWNPMSQHCDYHVNHNGKTIGAEPNSRKRFSNKMCNYVEYLMTPCGGYCQGRGNEWVDIGEAYWCGNDNGGYGGRTCRRWRDDIGAALRNMSDNMNDYWQPDGRPPKGPTPPDAVWGWPNLELGSTCGGCSVMFSTTQAYCTRPYVCVPDTCGSAWLEGTWQVE